MVTRKKKDEPKDDLDILQNLNVLGLNLGSLIENLTGGNLDKLNEYRKKKGKDPIDINIHYSTKGILGESEYKYKLSEEREKQKEKARLGKIKKDLEEGFVPPEEKKGEVPPEEKETKTGKKKSKPKKK